MSNSVYDVAVEKIDGSPAKLDEHKGSVMLVVNVASKCGLTPQYEGLEKLYENYRARGLVVVGFPANDFAGQEPGSNAEIQNFCTANFGVQFPMYSKIKVTGEDKHPLYKSLIAAHPERKEVPDSQLKEILVKNNLAQEDPLEVMWNFEKFLVSRDGTVVERFAPDIAPDDKALVQAVESELAR